MKRVAWLMASLMIARLPTAPSSLYPEPRWRRSSCRSIARLRDRSWSSSRAPCHQWRVPRWLHQLHQLLRLPRPSRPLRRDTPASQGQALSRPLRRDRLFLMGGRRLLPGNPSRISSDPSAGLFTKETFPTEPSTGASVQYGIPAASCDSHFTRVAPVYPAPA